ncbi:MAG: hypothetical protein MRY83_01195 [Flavobacteriales bacterium]|nr:hypothetical protein [Flavobacteriales bacterium]
MYKYLTLFLIIISWTVKGQNVGVGTLSPTNPLHIVPINNSDPLRVENFKKFQVNDSTLLVVDPSQGSIRYMTYKDLSSRIDVDSIPNLGAFVQNIYNQAFDSSIQTQNFIDTITSMIYNYGDTLLYNTFHTDSMTSIVFQNLLLDTNFLNLFETADTDVDSVMLSGYNLSVYEDSMTVSVNLQSIRDSAVNFIWLNLANEILNNSLLISELRDSINTDNQNLDSATLNGSQLNIYIENGNFAAVDLSSLQDADADSTNELQDIDSLKLNGNILEVFIEKGDSASVDLSVFNNPGTDNQNLDSAKLNGSRLELFIQNGDSTSVDLSSINTDIDSLTLSGYDLSAHEGGTAYTQDLESIADSAVQKVLNDSLFTPTSVIFADDNGSLSENQQQFYWDNNNYTLNIGWADSLNTVYPADPGYASREFASGNGLMKLSGEHTTARFYNSYANNNTGVPRNVFRRFRGYPTAPSGLIVGDELLEIQVQGADGNGSNRVSWFHEYEVTGLTPVNSYPVAKFELRARSINDESSTFGHQVREISSEGLFRFNKYAQGNFTEAALSKTSSNYILGLATDGTMIELPKDSLLDSLIQGRFDGQGIIYKTDSMSWDTTTYSFPLNNPTELGLTEGRYFWSSEQDGSLAGVNGWQRLTQGRVAYLRIDGIDSIAEIGNVFAPYATLDSIIPDNDSTQLAIIADANDYFSGGNTFIGEDLLYKSDFTGSLSNYTNVPLFQTSGGGLSIVGPIDLNGDTLLRTSSFINSTLSDTSSTLNIDVNSLNFVRDNVTFYGPNGFGPFSSYFRDVKIKANSLTFLANGFYYSVGARTFNFDVSKVEYTEDINSNANRYTENVVLARALGKETTDVTINVDHYLNNDQDRFKRGLWGLTGNNNDTFNLSTINVNVGVYESYKEINDRNYNQRISNFEGSNFFRANYLNTNINFTVKQAKGELILYMFRGNLDGNADFYSSNLNYSIENADVRYNIYHDNNLQLVRDSSVILIDCDYCRVTDDPAIRTSANFSADSRMIIKGKYKIDQVNTPVIYSTHDLYIENAVFENDGVFPLIESDAVPINVYMCNTNLTKARVGTNVTLIPCDNYVLDSIIGDNLGDHVATQNIIIDDGIGITDEDENTKIQLEETDDDNTIRFDTDGSERMIIDDNGNVGIGTSSASNILHVAAASDPVKLEGLENDVTLDTVLTVDPNGVIHKADLSDIININHGRIWYVSKSETCSGTARVGDPSRPFCNPWQAMDSVQEGDLVHVFPGTYTVGDAGSGEDIEIGVDDPNLWFNGQFYFDPGATILQKTTAAAAEWILFEATGNATRLLVKGNLNLERENYNTRDCQVFGIDNANGLPTVEFDAYRIEARYLVNTGDTVGSFICNLKYADYSSGGARFYGGAETISYTVDFANYAGNEVKEVMAGIKNSQCFYNIKNATITRAQGLRSATFGGSSWNLVSIATIGAQDSVIANYNIGNLIIKENSFLSTKILRMNDFDDNATNSTYKITIDNIIDLSTSTVPLMEINRNTIRNGTKVFIKLGSAKVSSGEFLDWRTNQAGTGEVYFHCESCESTAADNMFTIRRGGTNTNFYISGNYKQTTNTPFSISSPNAFESIQISNARIETGAFNCIQVRPSSLYLSNVKLVNSAIAPIDNVVATPVNVGCMGVYANSPVIDPDITELIEPITRNANVR